MVKRRVKQRRITAKLEQRDKSYGNLDGSKSNTDAKSSKNSMFLNGDSHEKGIYLSFMYFSPTLEGCAKIIHSKYAPL